jgi:hypothetical protein
MKIKFWETPAPVVAKVEKSPEEISRTELVGFLKDYGNYSGGSASAHDNEKRDAILKEIISRTSHLSKDEIESACVEAKLISSEINDLLYTIREQEIRQTV